MKTHKPFGFVSIAVLTALTVSSAAGATETLRYGQPVRVNGQEGQVISQGARPNGAVVVETRDGRGRSTGTVTLTAYDQAFRRQLHQPPGSPPSYTGLIRNAADLARYRSRGY